MSPSWCGCGLGTWELSAGHPQVEREVGTLPCSFRPGSEPLEQRPHRDFFQEWQLLLGSMLLLALGTLSPPLVTPALGAKPGSECYMPG